MDYSTKFGLDGIRSASSRPQEELIERTTEVLSADPRVLAAYLVGSFAIGTADAWSDVDLHVIISDEAKDELSQRWGEVANTIAPTAYIWPFGRGAIGGVCLTEKWLHFDLVFAPISEHSPESFEGVVPLVNKFGILPDGPIERPDRRGKQFFPLPRVQHFLYILGNCVSVIGRNEVVPATNGVVMVRDLDLVGLLLAEQGLQTTREHAFGNPFPFTKRLRIYLTDEQNDLLESLPTLQATIDSVIEGYTALAEVFIPRGRQLALATEESWPEDFERASVEYFQASTGARIRL
jgi:hypothetical protein